jgi:small subunit ribosomal protein S13
MPRVAGVDIPGQKRVEVALTYIYGIGRSLAKQILKAVNISEDIRARDLNEEQLSKLGSYIDKNFTIEGSLRREIQKNIQRLKDIGCYRGIRHKKGLPLRGQRTRTNARTRKGPRRTVAGKKQPKQMG